MKAAEDKIFRRDQFDTTPITRLSESDYVAIEHCIGCSQPFGRTVQLHRRVDDAKAEALELRNLRNITGCHLRISERIRFAGEEFFPQAIDIGDPKGRHANRLTQKLIGYQHFRKISFGRRGPSGLGPSAGRAGAPHSANAMSTF